VTGLTWLLLAMSTSVQPAEFHIETDTPDALCPELQLTRDAVTKRLGRLEVDGGGTWQGRYSTVHDPAGRHGDSVRLVITDPFGKEQLTRLRSLSIASFEILANRRSERASPRTKQRLHPLLRHGR